MPDTLLLDLQRNGFAMRRRDLLALGHPPIALDRAILAGVVVPVCNGWVATADAERGAIIAIINRGKLTSSSALASRGLWDGCDRRIHVGVPPNYPATAKSMRTPMAQFRPPRFHREGLVRHWVREQAPDSSEPAWRHSITDALRVASKHLPADQFVACVDSALHEGALSRSGLPRLEAMLSACDRPLIALVDDRAESGLESLARIRLSRWVRSVQPQFVIPGIGAGGGSGRVDLLINDWLVIELDGDQWHDPVRDRHRDAELVRRG